MYRVLIFGMTENPGGVESFLINYYRHIDREKIQFDFLCNSYENVAYEEELKSLGGRTFHIIARSLNYSRYKKELDKLFKYHASEWDAIWVNICSLANIDYLKVAMKYGIKRRIIHSHNSQNMDSRLRGVLHKWNKRNIGKYATDFWACSEDAAKWFYPKKELSEVIIIHNAIDVKRLAYHEERRNTLRKRLGCENEFVIGNVGRLHFQKNQMFMLDIFQEFLKQVPESRLILVGQGEDEQKLRDKSKSLGIAQKVYFAGVQKDIGEWFSAFDTFLFPSVFEGLGIAALEAQGNGIPVLASAGVIPSEVRLNSNFKFFNLDKGAEAWCKELIKISKIGRLKCDEVSEVFAKNGYDISIEVRKLEALLVGRE